MQKTTKVEKKKKIESKIVEFESEMLQSPESSQYYSLEEESDNQKVKIYD